VSFFCPSSSSQTNNQIKSLLSTAFFGWGVIDELRLVAKEGEKEVTVFFSRPLGKGLVARAAIEKVRTHNTIYIAHAVCS
jgi:hypothetical protein